MGEYYRRTFIVQDNEQSVAKIVTIMIIAFICMLLLILVPVFIYNTADDKIMSGVYIDNTNVSGLTKEEAKLVIQDKLIKEMPSNLNIFHNDYETTLNISQIEAGYDLNKSIEKAYEIGKSNNIGENIISVFKILLFHTNIDMNFKYNQNDLKAFLEDISTKLPDTIVQSSYYIEDNNLIITKGQKGYVVDVEKSMSKIEDYLKNRNYANKSMELITTLEEPNQIDIDQIHSEIYKEAVNAYYTTEPYVVHPHENGVDFGISLDEAKDMLNNEQEEYTIKLKYITPEITTNMIGAEAFPDLLSSFTTKYNASQKDRTTNLRLAANKIDGTVVMPGEIFSYNTVVGKRTIEAGYKNAAVYENGQVVDGLGGGICQISTTLYNAVLFANLEIVERRNHQFVPSYVNAGRDATVVYGTTDFRFKNNRSYPIRISCSVSGGISKFELYGLREENEYEVSITSRIVNSTSTSLKSETYKTLKFNGEIINSETISKDTYKKH